VSESNSITLSVVVPCYNEAARIGRTLDDMLANLPKIVGDSFEIIAVDDGSLDSTAEVIEALRIRAAAPISVVRHAANRGKGAAIRTGVSKSSGKFVLMADADGSTPIGEASKLLGAGRAGADIVIGSRATGDESVLLKTRIHRRLLGRLFNGAVNLLVLPGIRDTQCGFKLFSRRVVTEIFPKLCVDHFGFDIELLFMARRSGFAIKEVAVDWAHVRGSKVNLVKDSAKMLWMVVKIASVNSRIARVVFGLR
jgi:dolichyl-phosphate beta-glucosyltransferase